jgi:hypothetical protein
LNHAERLSERASTRGRHSRATPSTPSAETIATAATPVAATTAVEVAATAATAATPAAAAAVTTAAATTAAATTTATESTRATTATTAATRRATTSTAATTTGLALAGFVHDNFASIQAAAVQAIDRVRPLLRRRELDESEPARTAAHSVDHHERGGHIAKLPKLVPQRVLGRRVR